MDEYQDLPDDDRFGHDDKEEPWYWPHDNWRGWLRWILGIGWRRIGIQSLAEPEPYGDTMLHWRDAMTGHIITTYVWNEEVR